MKRRKIKSSYWLLGFFGFLGIQGFYNDPVYYVFFSFFGFSAYYWWGKLGTQDDERLIANRQKASSIAMRLTLTIIFVITVLSGILFSGQYEQLYVILLITVSLSFALGIVLWAYLTYRYDIEE